MVSSSTVTPFEPSGTPPDRFRFRRPPHGAVNIHGARPDGSAVALATCRRDSYRARPGATPFRRAWETSEHQAVRSREGVEGLVEG